MPAGYLLRQPRLVEERRLHRARCRRPRWPRPAAAYPAGAPGARRCARTSTTTVAVSPGTSCGDGARLAPVAREVLEQVADGQSAPATLPRARPWPRRARAARPAATGAGSAPAPAASSAGSRVRGRGERGGGHLAEADDDRGRGGSGDSLSGEQPPVARLAARRESSNSTSPAASAWTVSSSSGASAPRRQVISSAFAASCSSTSRSVSPGSPQATISSSTKPTASPSRKRPWTSSRAAGATRSGPHPLERLVHRRGVVRGAAARVEADRGGQAGLRRARGHDRHRLVGQLRRAFRGHDHVRAVGQDDDLLGRHRVDRRPAGRRWRG